VAITLASILLPVIEAATGQGGLMVDAVAQRVVPSRAVIFAYFFLLVYLVGLRQWYAAARSTALEQLVQARADILVASGALTAALAGTVDDARGMSSGSRAAADEMVARAIQSGDVGASSQAAQAVRDAARSSVRASSHRMWIDSATVRESMPWRDIFAVSLRAHPLPMAAAALLGVYGCLTHAGRLGGINPPGGIVTALIYLAWLALVFTVGRAVIRWRPPFAPLVTVAAVILAVMAPTLVPGLIDPALREFVSRGDSLVTAAYVLLLVVGTSVLLTARDSAGAVIAGLREARREAEVDRRVMGEATARLQRDVAQHVHGTVQPGLIAASIAIDEAVKHSDRAALLSALEDARAALDADFTPPPPAADSGLAEVLDDLRARWAGLLDVQCAGPVPQLAPDLVDAAEEVIQECLNNAYIHGGARHAQVEIATAPDGRTVVVVTDDGSGPGGGAPGLGSAIIAQATGGEWLLAPGDGGGAVVRAELRASRTGG
jgi:signal transduction histidine kinase